MLREEKRILSRDAVTVLLEALPLVQWRASRKTLQATEAGVME